MLVLCVTLHAKSEITLQGCGSYISKYAIVAYAKSPFSIAEWPGLSIRPDKKPCDFLVEKRKEAGLRQVDLAKCLKRRQDYVSYIETGQKRVDVVELMDGRKP